MEDIQTLAMNEGLLHSRIQRLRTYQRINWKGYVKRDDELSFGISGSKLRKYSSLLPFLQNKEIDEAILIGGASSNHILGMSQLLIENGIRPILFLRGEPPSVPIGNSLFISMLVPSNQTHWIPRGKWQDAEAIAAEYLNKVNSGGKKGFIIPEGGCCEASFPGAMTLGTDILRNETEQQLTFDHIFIDAGTGLSSIGLILSLAGAGKKRNIHIVRMAGNDEEFERLLSHFKCYYEKTSGTKLLSLPPYQLYVPTLAKSFGSVPSSVLSFIKDMARQEGFFLDPLYSAKLFRESRKIIEDGSLEGNCLIIHSGGALSLAGFQSGLAGA